MPRSMTIQARLTLIITVAVGTALVGAGLTALILEQGRLRNSLEANLETLAEVLGANAATSLIVHDRESAEETLSALSGQPSVVFATVTNAEGSAFASYLRRDLTTVPDPQSDSPPREARFSKDHLTVAKPIRLDGKHVGMIFIRSDLEPLRNQIGEYVGIILAILLAVLLLTIPVSLVLQRIVSKPILDLAHVAEEVSTIGDYSVRARTRAGGELGLLTSAFNEMLDQMQSGDLELSRHRDHLEELVDRRTSELREANADLHNEMSDRLRAEKALRLTQFSVDRAGESIIWIGADSRLLYVNDVACSTLGYSKQTLLSLTWSDIDPDFPSETWRRTWHDLKAGQSISMESIQKTRDGEIIPSEMTISFLEFDQNEYACAFVRDVSERKQAEEKRLQLEAKLRQSQKMEAVGRLAGGIAHDFNNLLTAIIGYCELLATARNSGRPSDEYVSEIRKAADRAGALTSQLLAFSRKQILDPKVLDLSQVVLRIKTMLDRVIGEHISLTAGTSAECWVKVDPGQMEQVIMNLTVNARDAMPAGGELSITTRPVQIRHPRPAYQSVVPPGSYVELAIGDSGHGMDVKTLEKIFEPFYTTRALGKGTGLGLSTVYGIVKQSGGHISVESIAELGTTFRVFLPMVSKSSTSSNVEAGSGLRTGSGTVLVVEDETGIRSLLRIALEQSGYHVLEAGTGPEALRIAEEYEGTIDVLLTDVIMPEMSGRTLAEQLGPQRPELHVIFMSGYTDDEIVSHGVLDPGVAFIQKPFSPSEITSRIATILKKNPVDSEGITCPS